MAVVLEGASGAAIIAARLHDVPEGMQRQIRPALRRVGQQVATEAKQNASWSSRIPRSIGVRVNFTGRKAGVRVIARAAVAPHARPYEGLTGRGDSFRHPVFGNREVWVAQQDRPFLAPAVAGNTAALTALVQAALDAALAGAGFN